MSNQYRIIARELNHGIIRIYKIKQGDKILTFREVLNLWINNTDFIDLYISIFTRSTFQSYVWETPPISLRTANQEFEFAIINSPFYTNTPDKNTFKAYFSLDKNNGIVCFPNLGKDALLIVPSPIQEHSNYSNLYNFYREATVEQQRTIWNVTAKEILEKLSNTPIWVSVAGGGVSWLHIRLDTSPKYYRYIKYADMKG